MQAVSIVFYAALVLFLSLASAYAGPNLVFDPRTGDVLYSSHAGDKWYPASLTKMMTAYLTFQALEKGKLTLKTRLKVSRNASRQPPSKIGLPPGAKISVNKALEALIIRSANDIAVVLAEGVGKTEANFIKKMNAAAKELGMDATSYGNPHGLPHKNQITTARDIGILAKTLITKFPQHRHYFKMQKVTVGKKTLASRNGLLKTMEGADGMKTGFICASGFNIVASATRGGRQLVAIVMGSKSAKVRNARAAQLLDWAFSNKADNDNVFGATKLAKLANGTVLNKPTNMRSVVCKPHRKKKKRRAKKKRKKKKRTAKKS
jgi:D-alanyl-D-alanine carboxypeptidase